MKQLLLLSLVTLSHCSPAPQYSGATSDLSNQDIDTIKDIFGDAAGGGDSYSGQQTGKLNDAEHIVKNEDGYVAPDDYQEVSQQQQVTKATSSVDNVFENCADYTETQGYECVPYYQCDNGTIITDGGGLIDIRNGFGILSPEDSKCPGFLDVCCQDPDFEAPPPLPVVKHVPKCGQRHENGLGVRIQGFREGESQFGEWPHMCAVLSEETVTEGDSGYGGSGGEPQTVNLYQCGGSLIAPNVILTAAHCVKKLENSPHSLKIRCGEWDTQDQNEPRPHQDRYVSQVYTHPQFNDRNLANDWALLYTESPFELQEHIDTICLPQPGESFSAQTCFATGWGKDKFGAAGEYQVVLKEIDLPVVGHDDCEARLRTTRLGKRFNLDDSFICAGGEGYKDTCKGDGGSPLVCASKYDPYTYVQAGIVAWGIGCGEDNIPGVYASVPEGLCWIDYVMSCRAAPQGTTSSSSYNGFSSGCRNWMDELRYTLQERVNKMQDTTLRGRAKAKALGEGTKAQEYLNYFDNFGCTVDWGPSTQPLTTGGDGYTDSQGPIDISVLGRDPGQGTDGSYVDPGQTGPLTQGKGTDGSYVDPGQTGPLTQGQGTDGSYVDPGQTGPLTQGKGTDGSYPSAPLTDGTDYSNTNSGDQTGDVKAPGPVY